jgi:hypothetical protein
MTRDDSGKPQTNSKQSAGEVAPCTIRGRVTGPEFPARVRILPTEEWEHARQAIRAKYWLARVPFLWSRTNAFLEVTL